MHNKNIGAELSAMTEEEQLQVNGGDGEFARTVGWFVGYAAGCTLMALDFNNKVAHGITPIFYDGNVY